MHADDYRAERSRGRGAVDASGKIYVANLSGGTLTTYNADGSASTPTITAGLNYPFGIAVH